MATSIRPESSNPYAPTKSFTWTSGEKAIARKAFEKALTSELSTLIDEVKRRAGKILQPSDLWTLECYLKSRRKEIDRKYDYRYSVLPVVFGTLIAEGRLGEQDLDGLEEEKLAVIRRNANYFHRYQLTD